MDPQRVTATGFICRLSMRLQTSVFVFFFLFGLAFPVFSPVGNLEEAWRCFLERPPRREVRGAKQRKCHLSGLEEPGG